MACTLGKQYEAEVRPMLKLVEELEDILEGHATAVSLPRIAVVGNQSSGKSSVLQRICSIALPQCADLCTRAPLILSMQNSVAPAAYIGKAEKHIMSGQIKDKILAKTQELAGSNTGISAKGIKLRVRTYQTLR
jgi:ABC-type transport system involved in cytochrome bd biosynthesis fused ATPase/permease subunit